VEYVKEKEGAPADMLVIKPGPNRQFTLYAGGGASALTVANALNQQYSEQEIRDVLKDKGLQPEEIEAAIANGRKAQEALAQGYTEDEIAAVVDEKDPKPSLVNQRQPAMESWQGRSAESLAGKYAEAYKEGTPAAPKNVLEAYGAGPEALQARRDGAYKKLISNDAMSAKDLVSSLQVLQPALVSLTDRAQGLGGNKLKQVQVEAAEKASKQKIIDMAAERGVNLVFQDGEYFIQTDDGKYAKATAGFWDEVLTAVGEAASGVAGAELGAREGNALTAVTQTVAKVAGSVGKAIGGDIGKGIQNISGIAGGIKDFGQGPNLEEIGKAVGGIIPEVGKMFNKRTNYSNAPLRKLGKSAHAMRLAV